MGRKQLVNFINLALALAIIGCVIIIAIINTYNQLMYYRACFALAGIGLLNLIFIVIREAMFKEIVVKKYNFVPHALSTFFGIGCYYLAKYLGYYDVYWYYYWIGLVFCLILAFAVYFIIDFIYKNKNKDSENKPKFIINK